MQIKDFCYPNFPRIPTGKCINVLSVKITEGNAIFRTDDNSLNISRVQQGLQNETVTSRIQMLSRKQTTPERLCGRARLREFQLIADETDDPDFCLYNGLQNTCGKCADCMIYGFAKGEDGSQKSRFVAGSLFSLSSFTESQTLYQRQAMGESGTMLTDPGEDKRFRNTLFQENVVNPQVAFLSVETLKDTTFEGFQYFLQNILETKRYGALSTRGGEMQTQILGIVATGAEIFSNLHWTQALFDRIGGGIDLPISTILTAATDSAKSLLEQECCRIYATLFDQELSDFLSEQQTIFRNIAQTKAYLTTLQEQAKSFTNLYGVSAKRGKSKN